MISAGNSEVTAATILSPNTGKQRVASYRFTAKLKEADIRGVTRDTALPPNKRTAII